LRRDYRCGAGKQFVTEALESLLFQYNQADLLNAAPVALSVIGACYLRSSSPEAADIKMSPAASGDSWKYLQMGEKATLKNPLVSIGETGIKTFQVVGRSIDAMAYLTNWRVYKTCKYKFYT
jgi:hypothetical protein